MRQSIPAYHGLMNPSMANSFVLSPFRPSEFPSIFAKILGMRALLFYLIYPFIFLIASLPFGLLYLVSDGLYFLLKLSGYRRKVVLRNLRNSFPKKSEQEIQKICNQYYSYLCDLTLETLKTLRMNEAQTQARVKFVKPPIMDEFELEKQSFIIVMGHYGNWEWAGPSFTLNTNFQLVVIYRPLANPYFERMLTGMRTRFGTQITPVKNTLRDMVSNRGKLTATAFVADQTATRKDAYWMKFLNQDTAVFTGPEKLAKKFNYPVVYMNVQRPRRGYYTVTPELLFRKPTETAVGEITEVFTRRIEKDIVADPTIWLWSHKRWKHTRPVSATEV
jgi:Kdo2-lipid IVA lauroyltransferase/acyltransferase